MPFCSSVERVMATSPMKCALAHRGQRQRVLITGRHVADRRLEILVGERYAVGPPSADRSLARVSRISIAASMSPSNVSSEVDQIPDNETGGEVIRCGPGRRG